MTYVPLWCKSNFSFLEGASHPDELVEQAHALGIGSLALTDRDGVYGMVRAHVKARELGVHLIVGAQVTIDDPAYPSVCVLLAMDRAGYANICRLITGGPVAPAEGRVECHLARGLQPRRRGDRAMGRRPERARPY